jgi:hypothetical protein
MKVLVVGSGGREHALVWKLAQSPHLEALYCAPGNAGSHRLAEAVPIAEDDISGLCRFARQQPIDLTVVGPVSGWTRAARGGLIGLAEAPDERQRGRRRRVSARGRQRTMRREMTSRWAGQALFH